MKKSTFYFLMIFVFTSVFILFPSLSIGIEAKLSPQVKSTMERTALSKTDKEAKVRLKMGELGFQVGDIKEEGGEYIIVVKNFTAKTQALTRQGQFTPMTLKAKMVNDELILDRTELQKSGFMLSERAFPVGIKVQEMKGFEAVPFGSDQDIAARRAHFLDGFKAHQKKRSAEFDELRKSAAMIRTNIERMGVTKRRTSPGALRQMRTDKTRKSVQPPVPTKRTLATESSRSKLQRIQPTTRMTDCQGYLDSIQQQMTAIQMYSQQIESISMVVAKAQNDLGREQYLSDEERKSLEENLSSASMELQTVEGQIQKAQEEIKKLESAYEQCVERNPLGPDDIVVHEAKLQEIETIEITIKK